jgi:3-isopropylmalate dehydrogenase
MSIHRYNVVFLAGDGVGPELTAEATRAVREVSRLHGFVVDEAHAPFGAEALARVGQLFPTTTRNAVLNADAVLVAARARPTLDLLETDLDLRAGAVRVCIAGRGDLVVLFPRDDAFTAWTVERAFAVAAHRRAGVTVVTSDPEVRQAAEDARDSFPGIAPDYVEPATALRALALSPERFDVVVGDMRFGMGLAEVAAAGGEGERVVATARLSEHGPSVFAPVHGSAASIAGQGVANPSSLLLAASFLLGEGLGEFAASETLGRAVMAALGGAVRTPDSLRAGSGATTREFTDAVLSLFQVATRTAEFAPEVTA